MMNNSTIEALKAMRFSAMAAEFERQLGDPAAYSMLGFEERFALEIGISGLKQFYEYSLVCIRDKVSGIVCNLCPVVEVAAYFILSVEQREAEIVEVISANQLEPYRRPYIEPVGNLYEKIALYLCLFSHVLAGIFIVVSVFKAYAPERTWEREKVQGIVYAPFFPVKYIVAPYSEQIETRGGDISKEGYVGVRRKRIPPVGVVDTCGDHSQTQFGVGRVVGASYEAYVELLVACLVGVGKVAVYFFPDASLFYGILYRYHLNGILPTGICGCKIICPEEK